MKGPNPFDLTHFSLNRGLYPKLQYQYTRIATHSNSRLPTGLENFLRSEAFAARTEGKSKYNNLQCSRYATLLAKPVGK